MIETRTGYKHTSLGWIPTDWDVIELKEIAVPERPISYGIVQTGDHVENGVKCIRVTDINDGKISSENLIRTSEKISASYKRTILKENDILIALRGKIGEVAIVEERLAGANLTRGVALLASKPHYSPQFLLQQLRSAKTKSTLEKRLSGSALQELSIGVLRATPIIVPKSLLEQQKIAEILNTWDNAIKKTQLLIEQLKQRNKGLTQQLLTAKPHWKEKKLSQIFERTNRRNTEGNTNVVTISAQRGFVRQNDFFKKIVASDTLDNYFLVKKGEFCYNKSYSNGYEWGATKRLNDFDEAVVTTLYICFGLNDAEHHSGDFFEYFFDANILDKGLSKIAHEGGRAHGLLNVTPSDFFNLKIQVPDLDEQNKIQRILSTAKVELTSLEQKLGILLQQKKGLTQKLLTGQVRIKP